MTVLFAESALLPEGWAAGVRIGIGSDGRITLVERDAQPEDGDSVLRGRALLPAVPNLHSHAFQRAMAGMTERRGDSEDSFWSWRTLMYRFLDVLTPDRIEAIAALVYMEMLEAGYASVGEFHYVHHQPGGAPYDDIAETSSRIMAAAAATGIGLTHLPVLYSFGGAREAALEGGQLRFGNDLDRFGRLVEGARSARADLPDDAAIGVAPHSLRATSLGQLRELPATFDGPIHIHAAEQVREVEAIRDWLGAPPVQVLLDEIGIDARWCVIHATHMTETETRDLARSGAVAGLCPITEANLGDGIFNGVPFIAADGRFGVGSDSNIRIALAEELRCFEYGQRLTNRRRNVIAAPNASVGETLYREAATGGAQALGRDCGALAVGKWADVTAIDRRHFSLAPLRDDQLTDGWIFAADDSVVTDVWSAGRHCVTDGQHIAHDAIERRYRTVIAEIASLV